MQPRRRRPSIIHGRLLNRCYLARIMPLKIREPGFRKLWCFGGRIPAVSTVLFVGDERLRLLVRPAANVFPTSTRNLIAFQATSWGTPRWISPSVRVLEASCTLICSREMEGKNFRGDTFTVSVVSLGRRSLWRFNKCNNESSISAELSISQRAVICCVSWQWRASLSIIFIRERSGQHEFFEKWLEFFSRNINYNY